MLLAAIQTFPQEIIPVVGIVFGCTVGMVGIIAGTLHKVMTEKYREQSRREIAAYVAEGSISPDDAAKLLSAGRTARDVLRAAMGR